MHCSLTLAKAFATLSVALCKGIHLLLLSSVYICYTARFAYSVWQFVMKWFHCLLHRSLMQILYTGIQHCYSKPVLQSCWTDVLRLLCRALTHGSTGNSYCCWWSEFVLCSVCSLGCAYLPTNPNHHHEVPKWLPLLITKVGDIITCTRLHFSYWGVKLYICT